MLKLASGSYDGTIKFWDPATGPKKSETITLKPGLIPNRIEISSDKSKLIAGFKNCVKIYDLNKQQESHKVNDKQDLKSKSFDNSFKGNVTAVGFMRECNQFYTGCEDGFVKIFDIRKTDSQCRKMVHENPVNTVTVNPSSQDLLSGDQCGYLRCWDTRKCQKNKRQFINQEQVGIRSVAVSRMGPYAFFADNQGKVHIISQNLDNRYKYIKAHDDYILKLEMSPNGKYLATCSADKRIKLFRVTGEGNKLDLIEHKVLKGHYKWVWDCQFSCDSTYLISCSTDGQIKLWNVEKGTLAQTLKGHERGIICLALNDIIKN